MQYQADDAFAGYLPVFNIDDYNIQTLDHYKKNGYRVSSLSVGVDIDTSRVLTFAPIVAFTKNHFISGTDIKFHIAPILEIKVNGSGSKGQMLKPYSIMIRETLSEIKDEFLKFNNGKDFGRSAQIDDTRKEFISLIDELGPDVEEAM